MKNSHFIWDSYSDQPHVIKDKAYKKAMRKKHTFEYIKLFLTSIFILPLSILAMKFFKGKNEPTNSEFLGLGVNLDKGDIQQELVEELGVKNLLIRVFLNDIKNIDLYVDFANSFNQKSKKDIVINIIQDRQNIEDLKLLEENLRVIFKKFENISTTFQIASTINRLKWGFFSLSEYFAFYKVAQKLQKNEFQNLKLLGPSIIDFEYYYNARAMFNLHNISYDITSALLYVDRRGAPQNKQYIFFDLKNKIDMLFSLVKLSAKTKSDDIYITEANWPIINTAPYAPTSEKECVSLEDYTKYMQDYIKIAKDTKKIKKVFWHQLVAKGYGLVDNSENKLVKYPQFYAFKDLLKDEKDIY